MWQGDNKIKIVFKMVANNKSCTSDSACYRPPTKFQEGNDLHLCVILFIGVWCHFLSGYLVPISFQRGYPSIQGGRLPPRGLPPEGSLFKRVQSLGTDI